jgi:hypothetical protein
MSDQPTDPIRKAINDCFGGMGKGSAIWGQGQYEKGFCAGVLAALTAYDNTKLPMDERVKSLEAELRDSEQKATVAVAAVAIEAKGQIERLEAEKAELVAMLSSLRNEASGFLAHANPQDHGVTNMRVLQRLIDEASAALTRVSGTVEPSKYCTREQLHDGPCNGYPRNDCVVSVTATPDRSTGA